jgi:phosphopantothenoylcysteine synthetase/decarboxylase
VKRIIITSGATRENIDGFHFFTTDCSGKIGSSITEVFLRNILFNNLDWFIDFIYVKDSKLPFYLINPYPYIKKYIDQHEVESYEDVKKILSELVPKADGIIHTMSTTDFIFTKGERSSIMDDEGNRNMDDLVNNIRYNICLPQNLVALFSEWNKNQIFIFHDFREDENDIFFREKGKTQEISEKDIFELVREKLKS